MLPSDRRLGLRLPRRWENARSVLVASRLGSCMGHPPEPAGSGRVCAEAAARWDTHPAARWDTHPTELLRTDARRLIEAAVAAEFEECLTGFADERLPDGRQRVVRNGHLPRREILTGIGAVEVEVPKLRSRSGSSVPFRSSLVPPYVRRSASLDAAVPWLYLHNLWHRRAPSHLQAGRVLRPPRCRSPAKSRQSSRGRRCTEWIPWGSTTTRSPNSTSILDGWRNPFSCSSSRGSEGIPVEVLQSVRRDRHLAKARHPLCSRFVVSFSP